MDNPTGDHGRRAAWFLAGFSRTFSGVARTLGMRCLAVFLCLILTGASGCHTEKSIVESTILVDRHEEDSIAKWRDLQDGILQACYSRELHREVIEHHADTIASVCPPKHDPADWLSRNLHVAAHARGKLSIELPATRNKLGQARTLVDAVADAVVTKYYENQRHEMSIRLQRLRDKSGLLRSALEDIQFPPTGSEKELRGKFLQELLDRLHPQIAELET